MKYPVGDPECPRNDGEDFIHYLHRLAEHMGYKVEGAALKGMPKAQKPFRERLDEIWSKREPGSEG